MAIAARGVLFSILGMLTWALLPLALGWTPTTVMTGSMEPRIHPGDVVVSLPATADAAALGHILLVDDPDHAGRLRLHRFAEFAPDGNLILRGDANSANDSTPVAPAAVHGLAVLRIPFVGLPMVWFAEKNWAPFAGTLAAVAGLTLAAASGSENSGGMPGPRGQQRALPVVHRGRRLLAGRTRASRAFLTVAVVGLVLCPGMLMSAPAHAGFSAAATTPSSTFSAVASYPCTYADLLDAPDLFYRFDEGSGTVAIDASKNARNGTLRGNATFQPESCRANPSPGLTLGGAAGSPGYVSTSNLVTAPDVFTVEIWFKTRTKGGRLIGLGDKQIDSSGGADRNIYVTDTGAIAFGAAPGNKNDKNNKPVAITSASVYTDGLWHQATATMSGAGMFLYIDGAEVARNLNITKGDIYDGYWRIGYDRMDAYNHGWPGASDVLFNGTVDNAAVYSAALTADQVKAHFNLGH